MLTLYHTYHVSLNYYGCACTMPTNHSINIIIYPIPFCANRYHNSCPHAKRFLPTNTFSRAMVSVLAKQIHNVHQFQKLCKILLQEQSYSELANSMQVVYCILKCENDIVEQQNCQEIQGKQFFDNTEEKMLLEENSFEIIMRTNVYTIL